MLTLALIVALAQTPQHRLFQQPNLPQATGEAAAFFEFAPTNGAGMGAACACTTPTGAKGEVMTYTRASNGTCTKTATGGLATTGIANGDLVVCSTNQPRVEYDGAGVLGLRVEAARTNSTLRSEELDNVAWSSNNSGIALPTVTANAATAPDGTVTADRLQIPGSTTAGHYSQLYQLSACPGGAAAQIASVYLRGVSGSGSVCLKIGTNVATCNYVSGSWSRCTPSINAAASTTLALAVDVTACGANATGVDVYAWGTQCENSGAYVTSYIPTTSATVTRALDSASLAVASFSSSAGMSWGANAVHPSGNGGSVWAASAALIQDATNRTQLYRGNTNVQNCDYFSTAGNRSIGPVIAAYVAGQNYRQSCAYSGAGASSTVSGYRDGVLTATSATGTTGAITITSLFPGALGPATSNSPADGIISRICLDPSLTRCL